MACGVKATAIVQLEPAATVVPHVLVSAKSLASAPVTLMPVMLREALPVLLSVMS